MAETESPEKAPTVAKAPKGSALSAREVRGTILKSVALVGLESVDEEFPVHERKGESTITTYGANKVVWGAQEYERNQCCRFVIRSIVSDSCLMWVHVQG